jgi:hypothetical protein
MPDYWSVPINNAGINDLNDTIAKGRDLSFIGKLPDEFWAGQEARNKQDQRNAFSEGLPKDSNGNIDWNAVTDKLAKVGGTSQISNILPLQKFDIARSLVPGNETQPQQQFPPSTSRGLPSQTPPQAKQYSDADVPTGTPSPPGKNLGTVTGIERGPVETAGPAGFQTAPQTGSNVTARTIAARTGGDATQIAAGLGVSPDDPIDPNDPTIRAKLVQTVRYTQDNPQGEPTPTGAPAAPQVQAPQATQNFAQRFAPATGQLAPQAQPQSTQPPPTVAGPQGNINEATAARYEAVATDRYRRAQAAALVDPAMSQAFKAQADSLMEQAKTIRGALAKNAETTPEMKNAASSNQASPLSYEGQKEAQKLQVEQGQKTYAGIQAQSSQFDRDLKPYIDLSKSVLSDPSMYSGVGGKYALDINRVRAAFGDQKAAMLQEALQKITASSVLGQINTQKDQMQEAGAASSRIFSQQVDLVTKAAPSLATTLGGNRFLVEVQDRMGGVSNKVAEMARAYKSEVDASGRPVHPLGLDAGFDQKVSTYLQSHPVFTDQERSHPEILGAPTVPPDIAGNKNAIIQWGKALGVQPGQPIRFPNGVKAMVAQ